MLEPSGGFESAASSDEAARVGELQRLRIMFTDPEPEFDAIARTAAELFAAPIGLVSLVAGERQWSKAAFGMGTRREMRGDTFSHHAVRRPGEVMVVEDATLDARFAGNPIVTGATGMRFYAGAPLVTARGLAIGTLCAVDLRPRKAGDAAIDGLRALALLTMKLIEERAARRASTCIISPPPELLAGTVIMFAWTEQARVLAWNRAAERLFGWSAHEVLGTFPPFILPADRARFVHDCRRALEDQGDVTARSAARAKDGRVLHIAMSSSRAVNVQGQNYGVSVIEDIGARMAAERRLLMLESVVVNSADAVVVTAVTPSRDASYPIVYVNDAFTRLTGYSATEVIGKSPRMLQGPGTDPAALERIATALRRFEPVVAELTHYRKDGSDFSVEVSISPVTGATGGRDYLIATGRDTTERRALDLYEADRRRILEMAVCNEPLPEQLARIVTLLRGVIPGSMGTVLLVEGNRLFPSAADPHISPAYIAGMASGIPIGPASGSCGTAVYLRQMVICGDIATDPRWWDGRANALAAGLRACWSMPMFGTGGDAIGAFTLYADRPVLPTPHQLQLFEETVRFASLVVERHRDRERLERLVLYDALTELPNRKLFEARFAAALARARASGGRLGVGVLDIDRFKAINDAFGHHVGDELLRQIAQRSQSTLRNADTVARMAGDEFLVLLPDLPTRADGITAARSLVERFDTAFIVDGYEIFVRPSLGVAFFPEAGSDTVTLMQAADRAMYAAKSRRGGFEVAVTPNDGSALGRLDLENDLRHALDRGEFALHYQMMYDLRSGRPVGAEALLRWNHPHLGPIAPVDFIPLAEANGTIVPIGRWVIGEAARVARSWQDARREAFIAVNVSALQFDEPGLVATVVEMFDRCGLEPHRLHLELTESLVMRNPTASETTLLQLRGLGVRTVIDDFGTGYSSLAYLQRFAFDALKIDRAFVRGIGDDALRSRSERIIAAVVQLGAALGVTTIAEGVEDRAQYAFVRGCGCDVVQGFLCANPVVAAEIDWHAWDPMASVA